MTTDDEPTPERAAYPDHVDLQRQSLEAADLRADAAVLRAWFDRLPVGRRLTAPIQLDEIAAAAQARDRERAEAARETAQSPAVRRGTAPEPAADAPDSGLRDVQFEDLSAPTGPPPAPATPPNREFLPFLALIVAIGLGVLLFRPTGGAAPQARTIGATPTSLANLAVRAATPPVTVSATTVTLRVRGELVVVREQLELTYASPDAGSAGGLPPAALTLQPVPAGAAANPSVGARPSVRDVRVSVGGVRAEAIPGPGTWAVRLPTDRQEHLLTVDYALAGAIGAGDTFGLVVPLEAAGVRPTAPVTLVSPGADVIGMTCPWLAESRCSRPDGVGRVAVVPAGANPSVVIAVDRP
ncbi:hypothetical protein ACIB24_08075 [Spongisporangium articulatum]|uniref:Uncharacterized protein n=1 Tax=Spongisporangium articulatum TaxID=3362603 RepID=A0ABW8AM13_9ACTN